MGSFLQRKPVRLLLSFFRWCRVGVLFGLFLAVAAVTYLHLIGLPDFLKRPLLRHLQEKGFQAQFTSMHLGWGPAVVIDNVAFSGTNQSTGPRLSAGMAQLALNLPALLRTRLEVDSFAVLDGRLQLPLSATNGDALSLDNVSLEVALRSNNVAQLQTGSASFRGIQIRVRGEITDFTALRNWRFPFRLGKARRRDYQAGLRRAAEIIRQIQFEGTPHLELTVVRRRPGHEQFAGGPGLHGAGSERAVGRDRKISIARGLRPPAQCRQRSVCAGAPECRTSGHTLGRGQQSLLCRHLDQGRPHQF